MEPDTGNHGPFEICINDLTSLMALPAMWVGCEPPQVLATLLDVIASMLDLDLAYGALEPVGAENRCELVRVAPRDDGGHDPARVGLALKPWLRYQPRAQAKDVPSPLGAGSLSVTRLWLGLDPGAGVVVAGSRRPDFPNGMDTLLLRVAVNYAVIQLQALAMRAALKRAQDMEQTRELLQAENTYLREERDLERHGDELIGESAALNQVLTLIRHVAPTHACVLIQGETGTGKELVARAIHRASGRSQRAFVKLNCAAIPIGLLETELFGHEKGAFTGAHARRAGRFELADGGTLFLDEVGEVPLEVQAKLLRVLQEREFERVGGSRTIRTDVRLIAASNRDLGAMVKTGQFRGDLYYRLKVFPIQVPPLRERAEDIPQLVRWFTRHHAGRSGRAITHIPDEVMAALVRYRWPGNVRELENLIERCVILSSGTTLEVPLAELEPAMSQNGARPAVLPAVGDEVERQQIVRALEDSGWVIAGPGGAASRLGMKRTSLQHKMLRLGIYRPADARDDQSRRSRRTTSTV